MSDQLSDISRKVLQYSPKYAKYYQIHVGTTYLILILAIGPVLFTSNIQIYLETLSLQWANNVPKLPGLHYDVKKLGTSHGVIIVVRANNYLCYKNLNSAGQIDFSEICPKKLQWNWLFFTHCFSVKSDPKFPSKLTVFFLKFVSENPAKFDSFPQPIRSPDYLWESPCPKQFLL